MGSYIGDPCITSVSLGPPLALFGPPAEAAPRGKVGRTSLLVAVLGRLELILAHIGLEPDLAACAFTRPGLGGFPFAVGAISVTDSALSRRQEPRRGSKDAKHEFATDSAFRRSKFCDEGQKFKFKFKGLENPHPRTTFVAY